MSTSWHALTIKDVFVELNTSAHGLSEKEVQKRRKKFGLNSLPKEKIFSRLSIFIYQFKSPLIYILLVATSVSGFLKEFIDMGVILAAVLLNVIIGFLQEDKANRALSQLKKMVERRAWVVRDGKEKNINAEELVPGDVVILEEGSRVSADGRLVEASDLELNEAGLTGESLPIEKDIRVIVKETVLAERKNMVYMGTLVTRGRGFFVVTTTGLNTHFGEIASMVEDTKEEDTPLQIRTAKFSKLLGIVIVAIVIFIFLAGILLGRDWVEMFITSVAIAVSSIPEGLPVAITIILAIGMQKMSKRNALTRKMLAAETLGSVSVICTDKTGTLTLGKMRVAHILTFKGDLISEKIAEPHHKNLLEMSMKISLLCNDAAIENSKEELKNLIVLGDQTEGALLVKAYELGFFKESEEKKYPRVAEISFSSEIKYMATLNKLTKDTQLISLKGAPEIILKNCSNILKDGSTGKLDTKLKIKIKQDMERLTSKGLRVLALAYREVKNQNNLSEKDLKNMTFVALVGLRDPLRETTKETIALTRAAGIRPVIVTGDHKLTAMAIGEDIGLRFGRENVLDGSELDKMTDAELKSRIVDIDIFARVLPKHKLRIVDAWQARGEVVAMTGDGVNDAPAIKRADIGIALGSGSDVTKETADMVLLDDNFKTIVSAVERGRMIFENIRKVMVYLLSDSFTEVVLISGSLFLGLPLPVTAAQILWVNLINDSFPSLALAFDEGDKEVMKDKPRKRNTPILNNEMKVIIFIIGILTSLFLFGIFYFVWEKTKDLNYARTITFIGLGIDSLFIAYSARSLRKNIWHIHFWNNQLLNFTIFLGVILLVGVIYIPFFEHIFTAVELGIHEWGLLLGFGMANLIMIEFTKWIFIHRHRTN